MAVVFDAVAVVLGLIINHLLCTGMFAIGVGSKAKREWGILDYFADLEDPNHGQNGPLALIFEIFSNRALFRK